MTDNFYSGRFINLRWIMYKSDGWWINLWWMVDKIMMDKYYDGLRIKFMVDDEKSLWWMKDNVYDEWRMMVKG